MIKQIVILLILAFIQMIHVNSISSNSVSINIITVPITNNYDSIGNASYCNNNSTLLCNVRSAFMLCNLYSNANHPCQIGKLLILLLIYILLIIIKQYYKVKVIFYSIHHMVLLQ